MTNSNVTPITEKQPAPSCRFTIQASLRGFPVTIEGEGRAGDLKTIVERLLAAGAEPPNQTANLQAEPTKPARAPLCPTHNTPMAPSTKRPGTYYCKSSVGQAEDGRTLYCTKKA
jgi:hypothetical protein